MKRLHILIITLFFIGLAARGFAFDFDFDKQIKDLRTLAGTSFSSGMSVLQGASSYFNKSLFASTPFGLAGSAASYFGSALTNYKMTLPPIPKIPLPSINSLGCSFDTALRLTNASVNIIRTVPLTPHPLNASLILTSAALKNFLPYAVQTMRDFKNIDLSKVDFNGMYKTTLDTVYRLSTAGIHIGSNIDWLQLARNFRSTGKNLVFLQTNFLNLQNNYALQRLRSNYLQ